MDTKKDDTSSRGQEDLAPPPYSENVSQEQATAVLSDLKIDPSADASIPPAHNPTSHNVVIHLKLLHAIQHLRNDISNQENLWGLSDSFLPPPEAPGTPMTEAAIKIETVRKRIQEKRWAIFVARASERFNRWWQALRTTYGTGSLTFQWFDPSNGDILARTVPRSSQARNLSKDQLPPLDILMVWHAFMLNPRSYLEDCLRQGMMRFWHYGLPWAAIDASLDESEVYDPGSNARFNFHKMTGNMAWQNTICAVEMRVGCPSCRFSSMPTFPQWLENEDLNTSTTQPVPWTTVEKLLSQEHEELTKMAAGVIYNHDRLVVRVNSIMSAASGYADPEFSVSCHKCNRLIKHDNLRADKLVHDILRFWRPNEILSDRFLVKSVWNTQPMPGTILTMHGTPRLADSTSDMGHDVRFFPNRLCDVLVNRFCQSSDSKKPKLPFSMNDLRSKFESACKDNRTLAYCQDKSGSRTPSRTRVTPKERIFLRKTFSHYWDNASPFALDLVGAVIRQGSFIEKMVKIDWLHSPTILSTASRVIQKYTRFMTIIAADTSRMAVPTLDVDLAWHTHQLDPGSYYNYTTEKTKGIFVNHDDKVAETALSNGFLRTSEQYQHMFGEPYSECTCWYCEIIRVSYTSLTKRLFRRSNVSQIQDQLHGVPSDPDRSPHISAHSTIRPRSDDPNYEQPFDFQMAWLRRRFETARQRARKDGRPEPVMPQWLSKDGTARRRQEQERWKKAAQEDHGYTHAYAFAAYPIVPFYGWGQAPYMCDPDVNANTYAANPACASMQTGGYGACCQGFCGGTVSAGACGGGMRSGAAGCHAGGGTCGGGCCSGNCSSCGG
ncbi:hypothetical protein FH972_024337 [Carpinus fangiana]|uniref:Glycine-rich domain-containing protein-like n=1 Tax=Carpinus fangiana TaxID=176857 RepID=A0A5N6KXS1_9ROSI|nr:hypothetical protein FH972_024337 [Carpinus fangiana]